MRLWRRGRVSQDARDAMDVERGAPANAQPPTEVAAEAEAAPDSDSGTTSDVLKPSRPSIVFDLMLLVILLAIGTAGAYWAWHIAHEAELKAFQVAFDGVTRSLNVDMTSKIRAKVRPVSQHGRVTLFARLCAASSDATHLPLSGRLRLPRRALCCSRCGRLLAKGGALSFPTSTRVQLRYGT